MMDVRQLIAMSAKYMLVQKASVNQTVVPQGTTLLLTHFFFGVFLKRHFNQRIKLLWKIRL